MCVLQVTATAEIDLLIWIPIAAFISGIGINILTVVKIRSENKDKMATKGYVLDQTAKVDVNILNLSKKVDENKKAVDTTIREHKQDNIRDHDSIKTEFHNTVKALDKKFDSIITLLSNKSGLKTGSD